MVAERTALAARVARTSRRVLPVVVTRRAGTQKLIILEQAGQNHTAHPASMRRHSTVSLPLSGTTPSILPTICACGLASTVSTVARGARRAVSTWELRSETLLVLYRLQKGTHYTRRHWAVVETEALEDKRKGGVAQSNSST